MRPPAKVTLRSSLGTAPQRALKAALHAARKTPQHFDVDSALGVALKVETRASLQTTLHSAIKATLRTAIKATLHTALKATLRTALKTALHSAIKRPRRGGRCIVRSGPGPAGLLCRVWLDETRHAEVSEDQRHDNIAAPVAQSDPASAIPSARPRQEYGGTRAECGGKSAKPANFP
ncbi:hypothetical protein [Marinibacterium sp. SX1]|uniref:hypothetical protein n=1 Tax=Marinibacterium sp. SX1 TaxID=3388424 RepID=UPI003D18020E